jgi:hypothetical protein
VTKRPELEGTPSQIAWATAIREQFIAAVGTRITDWIPGSVAWEGLCKVPLAKTWIENKDKLDAAKFVARVKALEDDIRAAVQFGALEDAVADQITESRVVFDDDVLDEADIYAIVYFNRIEVVALVTGAGDVIPHGRKYIGSKGDMRWEYELARLDDIRACKAIDFVLSEKGAPITRIGMPTGFKRRCGGSDPFHLTEQQHRREQDLDRFYDG